MYVFLEGFSGKIHTEKELGMMGEAQESCRVGLGQRSGLAWPMVEWVHHRTFLPGNQFRHLDGMLTRSHRLDDEGAPVDQRPFPG